jgi:hypothetical protein
MSLLNTIICLKRSHLTSSRFSSSSWPVSQPTMPRSAVSGTYLNSLPSSNLTFSRSTGFPSRGLSLALQQARSRSPCSFCASLGPILSGAGGSSTSPWSPSSFSTQSTVSSHSRNVVILKHCGRQNLWNWEKQSAGIPISRLTMRFSCHVSSLLMRTQDIVSNHCISRLERDG